MMPKTLGALHTEIRPLSPQAHALAQCKARAGRPRWHFDNRRGRSGSSEERQIRALPEVRGVVLARSELLGAAASSHEFVEHAVECT